MESVTTSIKINLDASSIFQIAKDEQEKFPTFMEDVSEVRIIQSGIDHTVTEWTAKVDGTELEWTEKDQFDDQNKNITWETIEGDFDIYNGNWSFESDLIDPNKTTVTLVINYDLGIPNLSDLIGPTLNIKVMENAQMMLEGLKKYCEKNHK